MRLGLIQRKTMADLVSFIFYGLFIRNYWISYTGKYAPKIL